VPRGEPVRVMFLLYVSLILVGIGLYLAVALAHG
jgi:hypothetical protein